MKPKSMGKSVEVESETSENGYSDGDEDEHMNDTGNSNSSDNFESEQEEDVENNGENGRRDDGPKKLTGKRYKKDWLHFAHVKGDEHLKQICQQNCLTKREVGVHKQVYYTCRRSTNGYRRKHPPPYCPMRALYIPEKQILYMKGGHHNHLVEKVMTNLEVKKISSAPSNEVHDKSALISSGQRWPHFAKIENYGHFLEICQQNCLIRSLQTQRKCTTKTISKICHVTFTRCKHSLGTDNDDGQKKNCSIQGIYVPATRAFYLRNGHNHLLQRQKSLERQKKGDEIVRNRHMDDTVEKSAIFCSGEHWPYFAHVENQSHLTEICRQNCLAKTEKTKRMCTTKTGKSLSAVTLISCKRSSSAKGNYGQKGDCPIQGIYLPSNMALYLRNKHNHPVEMEDKADENIVGNKYVDYRGQHWSLLSHVSDERHLTKLCQQQWLRKVKSYRNTDNYICKHLTTISTWPIVRKKRCPYHAILYKPNSSMYFIGAHIHSLEKEKLPPKVGQPYVDNYGRVWRYFKQFPKNISMDVLSNFCRQKCQLSNGKLKNNKMHFQCVQKYSMKLTSRCQYRAVFLTENSCLYFLHEHNHKFSRIGTSEEQKADFTDRLGKSSYRFLAHIKNEKYLKEICQKHWLIKHKGNKPTKRHIYFKCSTTPCWKDVINGGKQPTVACCQIKGVYDVKKRALYISKEGHNHPLDGDDHEKEVEESNENEVEDEASLLSSEEEDEEELTDGEEEEIMESNVDEEDEFNDREEQERNSEESDADDTNLTKGHAKKEFVNELELECGMEDEEEVLEDGENEVNEPRDAVEDEEEHEPGYEDEEEDENAVNEVNYEEKEEEFRNEREEEESVVEDNDEDEASDQNDVEGNGKNDEDEQEEKPVKEAIVQPIEAQQNVQDVQIVRAIIRDYKWLPGMKREGEMGRKEWPIFTIEDPNDYGHGKLATKKQQKNTQQVKKEVPIVVGAEPNPMQPSTSGTGAAPVARNNAPQYWWQQQGPAEPPKRLLRERKRRVNYAD